MDSEGCGHHISVQLLCLSIREGYKELLYLYMCSGCVYMAQQNFRVAQVRYQFGLPGLREHPQSNYLHRTRQRAVVMIRWSRLGFEAAASWQACKGGQRRVWKEKHKPVDHLIFSCRPVNMFNLMPINLKSACLMKQWELWASFFFLSVERGCSRTLCPLAQIIWRCPLEASCVLYVSTALHFFCFWHLTFASFARAETEDKFGRMITFGTILFSSSYAHTQRHLPRIPMVYRLWCPFPCDY